MTEAAILLWFGANLIMPLVLLVNRGKLQQRVFGEDLAGWVARKQCQENRLGLSESEWQQLTEDIAGKIRDSSPLPSPQSNQEPSEP